MARLPKGVNHRAFYAEEIKAGYRDPFGALTQKGKDRLKPKRKTTKKSTSKEDTAPETEGD